MVPSVRTDKSWNRKNIPGFRCSSFNLQAFADNGPTSVRVNVCRALGGLVDDGGCAGDGGVL